MILLLYLKPVSSLLLLPELQARYLWNVYSVGDGNLYSRVQRRNSGSTVLWQMLFLLKIIALLVYLGLVNILVDFRVI